MIATNQQPTKQRGTHRARTRSPVLHLSLHQAIIVIARMGGFLARAGDGNPGIKTLWHGLNKLDVMAQTIKLMRTITKDVGNA